MCATAQGNILTMFLYNQHKVRRVCAYGHYFHISLERSRAQLSSPLLLDQMVHLVFYVSRVCTGGPYFHISFERLWDQLSSPLLLDRMAHFSVFNPLVKGTDN